MTFEEWWRRQEEAGGYENAYYDGAKAAWDARQPEIDLLNARISMLQGVNSQLARAREEQKEGAKND